MFQRLWIKQEIKYIFWNTVEVTVYCCKCMRIALVFVTLTLVPVIIW